MTLLEQEYTDDFRVDRSYAHIAWTLKDRMYAKEKTGLCRDYSNAFAAKRLTKAQFHMIRGLGKRAKGTLAGVFALLASLFSSQES